MLKVVAYKVTTEHSFWKLSCGKYASVSDKHREKYDTLIVFRYTMQCNIPFKLIPTQRPPFLQLPVFVIFILLILYSNIKLHPITAIRHGMKTRDCFESQKQNRVMWICRNRRCAVRNALRAEYTSTFQHATQNWIRPHIKQLLISTKWNPDP